MNCDVRQVNNHLRKDYKRQGDLFTLNLGHPSNFSTITKHLKNTKVSLGLAQPMKLNALNALFVYPVLKAQSHEKLRKHC